MEASQKTALIVAQPGQLRNGFQVLLTAIPQLEAVMVVADNSMALQMMANHLPIVVLIDFDGHPEETQELLDRIKTDWPQIPCLILTDKALLPESLVSRADQVLRKGMSAANLFEVITQFIALSCGNQPRSSCGTDLIKNNPI